MRKRAGRGRERKPRWRKEKKQNFVPGPYHLPNSDVVYKGQPNLLEREETFFPTLGEGLSLGKASGSRFRIRELRCSGTSLTMVIHLL